MVLSVEIPQDYARSLQEIASKTGHSMQDLAKAAIEQLVLDYEKTGTLPGTLS